MHEEIESATESPCSRLKKDKKKKKKRKKDKKAREKKEGKNKSPRIVEPLLNTTYNISVSIEENSEASKVPTDINHHGGVISTGGASIQTPEKLEIAAPEPDPKSERGDVTYAKLYSIATSFREFYICTLERKLDSCRSYIHMNDSYTLDDDIISAYESITVYDW
eukprot:CAMPEP_0172483750 /NCGR_PEP_ID=MMETSP1066-20121228/10875_1 /TAXON_ID=671091 /ORGANISM="Coscinodiscus wailesii, Strain CCMP2513" /LENGTH=164 /DNA_ID=CAMNT_0013247821 /DNA_START=516 /DNA_END=1007 /DNA_ORIENTATION=-